MGLKDGKALRVAVQTTEKVPVNYVLEVKNPGGHSSLPAKDNAIYRLAEGLVRLAKFEFPVQLNETTRAWLERAGALEELQVAADMKSTRRGGPTRVLSSGCRASPSTTRNCARPASRPCSKAATRSMLCRRPPARQSIAACCRVSR